MKKLLLVTAMILAVSGLAMAQDFPKYELFGGYSVLKADLDSSQSYYGEGPSDFYYMLGKTDANFMNGFDFSLTRNLNSWLGIKGSFSRHSGTADINGSETYYYNNNDYYEYTEDYSWTGKADYSRYNFVFGPEFSYRKNSKVRPFAHALFGFTKMTVDNLNVRELDVHNYTSGEYNDYTYDYTYTGNVEGKTGFAMNLGGGLDIKAGKHFSIRLVQLDYMPTFEKAHANIDYIEDYYVNGTLNDTYERRETFSTPSMRFNNLKLSFGVVIGF
jgi:hypothetical protein